MQFFFADDSRQPKPTRPGVRPLVAIGGVSVPEEAVQDLEGELERLCGQAGFPDRSEFKWSPGPDLWMHDSLVDPGRADFFRSVLQTAKERGVSALVVIEDTQAKPATDATTPEMDITRMFLERADSELGRAGRSGLIVADRTGSNFKAEEKFLTGCLETLQSGTKYAKPEHIVLNVVSTPSKLIRLIQLADLVAGCTLALVSGENTYAPATFEHVKPLLCTQWQQIGGVGLKIHPDFRYRNLYHWLLGDTVLWKGPNKVVLPVGDSMYARGPRDPARTEA